jgi:hypothetical protein
MTFGAADALDLLDWKRQVFALSEEARASSDPLQLLELGYTGQLARRPRLAACERARLHGELPVRA